MALYKFDFMFMFIRGKNKASHDFMRRQNCSVSRVPMIHATPLVQNEF